MTNIYTVYTSCIYICEVSGQQLNTRPYMRIHNHSLFCLCRDRGRWREEGGGEEEDRTAASGLQEQRGEEKEGEDRRES